MDVVRIETLSSLCERGSVRLADPAELTRAIGDLLEARDRHEPPDDATSDFLTLWLDRLNAASDARPMFVSPFAEVESILDQPDWANQLRDALGLSHIRSLGGTPSRERPYLKHRATPAWAATPTVLDDPGTSGLNVCFFPAPIRPHPPEYGCTVNLTRSGASKSEFLHAPIKYMVGDICRIGDVTTRITDDGIALARQDHFERHRTHYRFHADVPVRP
jgi:hypothetical protein